jgi:hypothetical protein
VPTILAGARVGQRITRHHRQAEYIVKLAIGEQPSIRGHHRAAKLQHQAAVKIESQRDSPVGFVIAASLDPR